MCATIEKFTFLLECAAMTVELMFGLFYIGNIFIATLACSHCITEGDTGGPLNLRAMKNEEAMGGRLRRDTA